MGRELEPLASAPGRRAAGSLGLALRSYWGPLVIAALLLSLYAGSLVDLFRVLLADPNSSHGLLIPPIAGFLLWRRRRRLAALPKATEFRGLFLVFLGVVLLPLGAAAEIPAMAPFSLLVVAGGLVWHVWGNQLMRAVLFPYLYLFFTIPWPGLLVETLTFHLQLISAKSAALVIGLLGMPVVREGVEIQLGGYKFEVAAPCSGIRSMAALMALGALCAYLLKGTRLRRIALFLLVPPLAMIGNAFRIVVILLIAAKWGTEAANGFYHEFSGLVLFLATFLLLLAAAQLMGMKQLREEI